MPTKQLKSRRKTSRPKRRRANRRASPRGRQDAELALAAFAHEIRTSLTGILALGELLATSGLGEREARWAGGVKTTAEHLSSLVNLLIDAAKAGRGKLVLRREPFYLRRLVDSVALSLTARAEIKGLPAETTIAATLPARVVGDGVRLRAALENLIDNAVKFTDNGSVQLAAAAKSLTGDRLMLEFSVTDTGIGVSPAELKRLFRPFAQASDAVGRRYGGTGLGLVFVKRIAEAMGGNLTVSCKPGKGSRFQFTAVVQKAPATPRGGERLRQSPVTGRSLSILCAEDNPFGRVVLNTILSELGHRTDFVGTGAAAVEAAGKGNYDLVLMDIVLPGVDGLEATRRIRAMPAPAGRVPIIGISGRAAADDETKARSAGMNGYVGKPVSPRMLAAVIADVRRVDA